VENLTYAIRRAVEDQNWTAALALSLTSPDICGGFTYPQFGKDKKRYIQWYDDHLLDTFTMTGWAVGTHVFLSGADCYALRCAFLHSGSDDITSQPARQTLTSFEFTMPPSSGSCHRTQGGGTVLQLQIDLFCLEFAGAVEGWWNALSPHDRAGIEPRVMPIRPPLW
jgi:hypothetical protein